MSNLNPITPGRGTIWHVLTALLILEKFRSEISSGAYHTSWTSSERDSGMEQLPANHINKTKQAGSHLFWDIALGTYVVRLGCHIIYNSAFHFLFIKQNGLTKSGKLSKKQDRPGVALEAPAPCNRNMMVFFSNVEDDHDCHVYLYLHLQGLLCVAFSIYCFL